ncbi:MAG TPA: nicotinate-nucleotide adenylyltransferase [Pseudoxanthomonas sp.]|nr:nicotinate-nucleotide adenylyltransferase [Pseudoxanthomonas sp.]
MPAAAALQCFYGGTFDPVHNGHLAIARAARDQLGIPVRLMPAADPPHRKAPGADARQRADMLELAIDREAGLCLDRRELQRSGPSYSVDTLRALRRELGDAQPLALLLGADSFLTLPSWREWRTLFELAHLVIADRPGSRLDHGQPAALAEAAAGRWANSAAGLASRPAGSLMRLEQPLHPESASDIRRRIADSRPWRQLVAPAVAVFIDAHRLYTQAAADAPL